MAITDLCSPEKLILAHRRLKGNIFTKHKGPSKHISDLLTPHLCSSAVGSVGRVLSKVNKDSCPRPTHIDFELRIVTSLFPWGSLTRGFI